MVKRAYKYRFYPTTEQAVLLAQTFGCARVVYNTILKWRTDAYYQQKESIGYSAASRKLTELKKQPDFEWLNDVSCVPLQQSLRHQQGAFKNFFAGRAKYPVFKKKSNKQSVEFTKSAFNYINGKIYIAKNKDPLDIKWSRDMSSAPSSITISKDSAGRYFVSCLCEFKPELLKTNTRTIGIDLGIKTLFVTNNGEKTGNPRYTAKYAETLAKMQRRLSKKKLGSANRVKARIKVARVHAKISDCRLDNLHKLSRRLINDNQVICVETLKVKNMVKNSRLSKAIADAGWGEFVLQLEYKSEWSGRTLVKIDQWFPSSKRCNTCGHTVNSLPLNIRHWECPECNTQHDRDHNAAKNILAEGLSVLAFGENVSGSSIRC